MLLPVNSILNLAVCSTLTSPSSKVDTLSAQLLLPYLAWTSFAAVRAEPLIVWACWELDAVLPSHAASNKLGRAVLLAVHCY